ncbi:hypothetical protein CCR97_01195 [Rhodoplanes elegans]|uniref:Blue-light-activated histidine kinase n=1 Tax=Rhodoplanes elegans TaxID=29408 RepID=A0A327KRZ3_9BRAD|nr:PAS domain S-box protein [Rhodoplanes elegans]MBK5956836.1 hypothetical protein [Rhodoplanes elegans]RAI40756.1 hypothetical protein CH338_05205 [Rhodoplanes elegans]
MISDEQLRLLFESAPNGMIVTDRAGRVMFVNAHVEQLFGYSREELIGRPIEILVPERFRAGHTGLRDGFARNPRPRPMGAGRDLYGRRKDGDEFPLEIGINPFRTDDGNFVVASVVDISERKRHEEHIRFIMNELSHRSKNLLMVVLAIANQTVQRAISFGEFQKLFEDRLMAIGRCHDLLVEKGWAGASIDGLISAQIEQFTGIAARIDAEGPAIMIHPEAAQNIGLAFHELAMNAVKYGALSSPDGRVVIRWDVDQTHTTKRFRLTWEEQGGPPVDPPRHEGFGHKLLSRISRNSLDGTVSGLAFRPEGLSWRLECPGELVIRH